MLCVSARVNTPIGASLPSGKNIKHRWAIARSANAEDRVFQERLTIHKGRSFAINNPSSTSREVKIATAPMPAIRCQEVGRLP